MALNSLICPVCKVEVEFSQYYRCLKCKKKYYIENNIPLMFEKNNWFEDQEDITENVKLFYEKDPFPNYEEIESVNDLILKAEKSYYAKFLNDQIPFNSNIIEIGCGTGQLINYLGLSTRNAFGTDMCLNSLKIAESFRKKNDIKNVNFFQMNLFNPIFKPDYFDLVICQGVLHHTSNPYLGFESIQQLVKPGGYIIIGLYNKYGRLITDLRRMLFKITNNNFRWLDPRLKEFDRGSLKRNSWFNDQYKHPHESKHSIDEILKWFEKCNFRFINAIPKIKFFSSVSVNEKIFSRNKKGNKLEHLFSQIGTIINGYKEGGLFIMIGQKK